MRALLCLLLFFSTVAFAQPSGSSSAASSGPSNFGLPVTLYVDAYAFYGVATGKIQGDDDSVSLTQQGVGLSIGPMFDGFLLAIGTDYRQVNNSKAPDSQVGSFKGTRWAPLVLSTGYVGTEFLLKIDYQPMGIFNLTQPTYQGSKISYSSGGGYRVNALYNIWSSFMVGPQYESLKFSSRFDTGSGQTEAQALTVTQFGLTATYVF